MNEMRRWLANPGVLMVSSLSLEPTLEPTGKCRMSFFPWQCPECLDRFNSAKFPLMKPFEYFFYMTSIFSRGLYFVFHILIIIIIIIIIIITRNNYIHQKRYGQHIRLQNDNNQETKMREKTTYGRFKRLINNISHQKTWTWLRKGSLKRETESLLRTNRIKVRIDKTQQRSKRRLCG